MLVSEIKDRVERIFGDESGTFLEPADMLAWINDGQLEIVKKTDCLVTSVTAAITALDNSYAVPADFLKVIKLVLNGVQLTEAPFEGATTQTTGFLVDVPSGCYTIWNSTIYFASVDVNTVVNYTLFHTKRPAALTVDADIPAIPLEYHEDIVRFCLVRAKEMEEDYGASDRFLSDFNIRIANNRGDTGTKNINSYGSVRVLDSMD